jgi:hypothetical protein
MVITEAGNVVGGVRGQELFFELANIIHKNP